MTDEKRNEFERKVNSTTDVQEACHIGFVAGYEEGCEATLNDVMSKLKGIYDKVEKHEQ